MRTVIILNFANVEATAWAAPMKFYKAVLQTPNSFIYFYVGTFLYIMPLCIIYLLTAVLFGVVHLKMWRRCVVHEWSYSPPCYFGHVIRGCPCWINIANIVKYNFNLIIIRFETLCALWVVLSHIICFRQAICAVLYIGNVAVIWERSLY